MKIGFIGIGNMGSAMLSGCLNTFSKEEIYITDVNAAALAQKAQELGVNPINTNSGLVQVADFVVLAVKPQYLSGVLTEIAPYVKDHHIFLTLSPGVTIEHVFSFFDTNPRIVRSMPNTPALVLEGMTVISYDQELFSEGEESFLASFLSSFGRYIKMEEHFLDMVVPVSGSSPAYMFMMLEAMGDAGVQFGLPRKVAYELAAQTMLGAAKMVLETGEHPGVLKDAVCSPGGTTIEAVRSLERTGFRSSVIESMVDCYDKTKAFK